MRIACTVRTGKYYGAENMTVLAAKHMSANHEVFYCSPEGDICEYLKDAGITHVPIKKLSIRTLRHLKKTLKPDIFLVLDNKASLTAALAGVPFVSYQQNNWPFITSFNPYSLGMLFYCLCARKVIGVTDYIIEEFVFAKYIRNKYTTIVNVVDYSNVKKLAGEIPKEKTYDLCFFGRMDYQKHPELFVNIVKKTVETHPETTAVIVGRGEMHDEINELVAEMGLQDKITFTGFLPNPFEVVKQAKMVAMTSRWEGFCIAAFEAMYLGLPVIASRVPVLDRNIDDSCGALCDTEDDFYKAITELLDDEELYKKKSQGAEARALVFGDVEKYAAAMEKVCLEAAEMG